MGEDSDQGWAEYRTSKGYSYYYNATSGESQWGKPEGFQGKSHDLTRDEIQNVVTKVTADYDRWALLKANEPLVVQLQARWRGISVRKAYHSRLQYLRDNESSVVAIQARWKGYRQQKAYRERLDYLKRQMDVVVKVGGVAMPQLSLDSCCHGNQLVFVAMVITRDSIHFSTCTVRPAQHVHTYILDV